MQIAKTLAILKKKKYGVYRDFMYSAIVFLLYITTFTKMFPFAKNEQTSLNFAGIHNLCFYEIFLWGIYET